MQKPLATTVKREGIGLSSKSLPIPTAQLLEMQDKALNASSLGVVIADATKPDLPIIYANPAFFRLSKSSFQGGPLSLCRLLKDGECESGGDWDIYGLVKEGRDLSVVVKNWTGKNALEWTELTISPVQSESGEATHIVAIINDITDQRLAAVELHEASMRLEERVHERTAALEQINQDLEGFTYSVSHDLRAPLRAIMGFSKMLVEDHGREVDAEMRQTLARINAAASRMTTIIEDLLTFSRLGRKEMVREKVELSQIAEAIGSDLIRRHPDRNTQFQVDANVEALGDPTLIRIALENLLDNAYKFTSKKKNGLVEFRQLADHRFVVRDNGAGFDPKYSNKLFRPFERLHSASEFPGTGIGLANVRRIIERHGGKIWAEGQPNQGASFYFEL